MNPDHANLEARFAAPAERDLPPGRHDKHREILMNHMLTSSGHDESAPARQPRRPRRRILAIGGTAVIGVAAAAVAVIATSAAPSRPPVGGPATSSAAGQSRPVADGRAASSAGTSPSSARTSQPSAGTSPSSAGISPSSAGISPLIRLADYVSASAQRQSGNATLVIRTSTYTTGEASGSGADLYTDSGAYYWAPAESGLPAQIAAHHNLGDGMFAREVAAAVFAANNGSLAIARDRMADDPALSGGSGSGSAKGSAAAVAARAKAIGVEPAPGQSLVAAVNAALFNNLVWNNSTDALVAGAGNPEVRAGVLRLLATVPGITVTNTTTGGQPTLVVTDTKPPTSAPYEEALTLNATTGIPVQYTAGVPGKTPDAKVAYKVSRVTVAAIAAGKF
ncbi:MAG TPA: hypothetical protein VG142_17450 [Trebonia sp.]|jgi:hypothetical protein|nr:hypothetical protein [Trebonia sp.]